MIYLDLDNTLLNSSKRHHLEVKAAERHGMTTHEYFAAIEIAFRRHGIAKFSYETFYESCKEVKPGLTRQLVADWHSVARNRFIFRDSIPFLRRFPREMLQLLTTGAPEFQNAKIRVHGLRPYFARIMIAGSPKALHMTPPLPGSFFLDDSPREIDAMKTMFPFVRCIQVREPAPWETQRISRFRDTYFPNLSSAAEWILRQK